ncbi:MAG: hemolysin III family protein [Myxococcales bacterium]|nr:hemolysin III family protein [Myxococcales bacterium]
MRARRHSPSARSARRRSRASLALIASSGRTAACARNSRRVPVRPARSSAGPSCAALARTANAPRAPAPCAESTPGENIRPRSPAGALRSRVRRLNQRRAKAFPRAGPARCVLRGACCAVRVARCVLRGACCAVLAYAPCSRHPEAVVAVLASASVGVKPRLRGVSHELAFYAAIVATVGLGLCSASGLPRIAGLVYGGSLVALFGTSALYHRPTWRPAVRAWLRRADHAAIFVLIGGSYAPMGLLALPPEAGHRLLAFAWGGCLVGLVKAMLWPHSPRWVTAASYLAVGWAVVIELGAMGQVLGSARSALVLIGGLFYSVGALAYAKKRPNPWPAVFGYHEIFHAFVVLAASLHFIALGSVVLEAR